MDQVANIVYVKPGQVHGCDFCAKDAQYDFKTNVGPWANGCAEHFKQYGGSLGTGKGQKYVVGEPPAPKPTKQPSLATLQKWSNDGVAKATDGCKVEPDGTCAHGKPSWLLKLGLI